MPGGKVKTAKTLSLCEKLQLIEEHEKRKRSARELAVVYGIGKTQVYETLRNKEKIKSVLSKGTSGQRKRLAYVSSYEDINSAMWEWFSNRLAEGLPVSGPLLQAEALKLAQTLGKTDFKASNGWLESFRLRHNIVYRQARVGAKDVIVQIEDDWKQNLPKMTEGYREENIFIGYETGLCYKTLAKLGCPEKLGVLLCSNMTGMLLKPLVVGKIARPKAFRKLDAITLPVQWRPSSQTCITNFVLEEWLHCFNEMVKLEERNVILFLDNISSTFPLISLSNVKLIRCHEPMNQGVVTYFKWLYRKNMMQTFLLKLESAVVKLENSVNEVCKSVSVLDAVNWIAKAVSNIPPDSVRKCFVKSGFAVRSEFIFNDDAERNVCADLVRLCQRLNLDPEDVIHFNDVIEDDGVNIKEELDTVQEEERDTGTTQEEEKLEIDSYVDAVKAVNALEKFAAEKNCPQLLNLLQDAKEALSQSCLDSAIEENEDLFL